MRKGEAADRDRLRTLRPELVRRGMGRHLLPAIWTQAGRIGMLVAALMVPTGLGGQPLTDLPAVTPLLPQVPAIAPMEGIASWYSQRDRGVRPTTASMERFDDRQLTCAIWGVPFNTRLRVTNLANGRSVVVRVNDRGPAPRLRLAGRIVDLTRAAFAQLAPLEVGLIRVRVESTEGSDPISAKPAGQARGLTP